MKGAEDMVQAAMLERLSTRAGVPVQQVYCAAGSVRTSCLVAGEGQPVLLIHGAGGSGATWYPVLGALAPHFQAIAPDVVGHGETDRPPAIYDRAFYSSWLANLVAALGLRKATVVGHSLGGAIALQFTLDHPEMVDRLVLVSPLGLSSRMPRPALGFVLAMAALTVLPSAAGGRWLLRRYVVADPRNARRIIAELAELAGQGGRGSGHALRRGGAAVASPIPREQLARIRQPTLVIWGEEDRILPLADGRAGLNALPNARLVAIPGTGHMSPNEEPEAFNEALLGFLTARAA